ncbi:hypothetical protein ACHAXS_008539 [Conticribra weissflogii]
MASSRWKRFAFFDRKNLPLPPAVTKDLVPSSNDVAGNQQRQRQRQSRQPHGSTNYTDVEALDPRFLYPEEFSWDDCAKIGHGEYFSLVAAENVALPSSLFGGSGDGAIKRGAGGDGAPAMQAGLMAMKFTSSRNEGKNSSRGNVQNSSSFETSTTSSTKIGNNSGGSGELLLLFASSRNTSLVHCIDVTVRCTPQNPHSMQESVESGVVGAPSSSLAGSSSGRDAFASTSSNASNHDANNPEDMDGWRGHYNPFLAADGFIGGSSATNASYPLASGGKNGPSNATIMTGSSSGSKSTSTSVGTARGRSAAEKRILEEHLSGSANDYDTGGSLFASSPFASPNMDVSSTVETSLPKARIVGLATCGLVPSFLGKKDPQQTQSGTNTNSSILYVASITDASNTVGLVVHANPHLILSTQLPSSTISSTSSQLLPRSTHSHYYKPDGQFNFVNHGKPTCVTILPGVVGVGTDRGMILIYVYDYLITPSNERGGRLSLVAEIPAPRGGSSIVGGIGAPDVQKRMEEVTPYSVSSLELINPSPLSSDGSKIDKTGRSSVTTTNKRRHSHGIHRLFVSYRRRTAQYDGSGNNKSGENSTSPSAQLKSSASGPSGGVCCYELGGLRIPGKPIPPGLSANAPVVSARYDMDGRDVGTSCLCDAVSLPPMPPSLWISNADPAAKESGSGLDRKKDEGTTMQEEASTVVSDMEKILPRYSVARGDGLHFYSPSEKVGVCPVDGNKIAMCSIPPPPAVYLRRPLRPTALSAVGSSTSDFPVTGAGASYSLVATTDSKSGRDAVDIYDTTNKLVGFHVLLSPGHRALRAVGISSSPTVEGRNLIRGGRSSAIVMTSGGSIVTLTEKVTPDKVALLVQKNLYSAAISIAFLDPAFYRPEDITALYRRYAEHLYRKGDFAAAMDQYILTIGSLESDILTRRKFLCS